MLRILIQLRLCTVESLTEIIIWSTVICGVLYGVRLSGHWKSEIKSDTAGFGSLGLPDSLFICLTSQLLSQTSLNSFIHPLIQKIIIEKSTTWFSSRWVQIKKNPPSWGQCDSIVLMSFALHMAKLCSIPSILIASQSHQEWFLISEPGITLEQCWIWPPKPKPNKKPQKLSSWKKHFSSKAYILTILDQHSFYYAEDLPRPKMVTRISHLIQGLHA